MNRKYFLKVSALGTFGFALKPDLAFLDRRSKKLFFKISLAQWSLHRTLQSGKMTTLDFPAKAKRDFGLNAVEYVSQFFADKATDKEYLKQLAQRCADNGVYSHLIMVDNEGHLAATNARKRDKAVDSHKKWVDAARLLGCKSIRINLHGDGNESDWKLASIVGLGMLGEYGAQNKVNIIVENHGQWSSKGSLVAEVLKQVNNSWCGTLPDFGNFCVRRRDGDLWESPCVETYDAYKGVAEMLPFAKGVSAKTFDFDSEGNDTIIDFRKMLQLVKNVEFNGYIGIEYEGKDDNEDEGIRKTIALLKKVGAELS